LGVFVEFGELSFCWSRKSHMPNGSNSISAATFVSEVSYSKVLESLVPQVRVRKIGTLLTSRPVVVLQ